MSRTESQKGSSGELFAKGRKLWRLRRHLLDTRDLDDSEIEAVLQLAMRFKQRPESEPPLTVLAGKTIAHLFYENSTRTRASFEIAEQRLGARTLNLDTGVSSVAKGESISDTALQLVAMGVTGIVQRHSAAGAAHHIVDCFGSEVHVVNAGDGWYGHPTQGLLDFFTMKEVCANLKGVKIAIVGDITHSRVARSNLWLLRQAGADIHMAGPPTLLPKDLNKLGVVVHTRLEPALEGSQFVMALRLQLERQKQGLIPSIGEYRRLYRIDHARLKLAAPTVRLLHPGPVNRGIEITDDVARDEKISLIKTQVTNGVLIRMAVMSLLMAEENQVL